MIFEQNTFLTFVYLSKCNRDLPCIFGNSKKKVCMNRSNDYAWWRQSHRAAYLRSSWQTADNSAFDLNDSAAIMIWSSSYFHVLGEVTGTTLVSCQLDKKEILHSYVLGQPPRREGGPPPFPIWTLCQWVISNDCRGPATPKLSNLASLLQPSIT